MKKHKFQKIALVLLCILWVLLPTAFVTRLSRSFVEVTILLTPLLGFVLWGKKWLKEYHIGKPLLIAIGTFTLLTMVAQFIPFHPLSGLDSVRSFHIKFLLVILSVLFVFTRPSLMKAFLAGCVFAVLFSSYWGGHQWILGHETLPWEWTGSTPLNISPFGYNANRFGAYFAYYLPLCAAGGMAFQHQASRKFLKWVLPYALLMAAGLWVLLLTRSRASQGALAVAMLFFTGGIVSKKRSFSTIAVFAFLLLLLVPALYFSTLFSRRAEIAVRNWYPHRLKLEARKRIWADHWEQLRPYRWFGLNFSRDQRKDYIDEPQRHEHSMYLKFIADSGLVGLTGLLVLAITLLANGFRRLVKLNYGVHYLLLLGAFASFLGLMIRSIVDSSYTYQFELFTALLLALTCIRKTGPESSVNGQRGSEEPAAATGLHLPRENKRMFGQLRKWHFYMIVVCDSLLCALALGGAYLIRFDFELTANQAQQIWSMMPYVLLLKLIVFYMFGMYRGMWRYTSISELINLVKATALSSLIISSFILFRYRFEGFSRSVFALDAMLTLVMTTGVRVSIRIAYQKGIFGRYKNGTEDEGKELRKERRVVIVGAGDAGEKTYREIKYNPNLTARVVAFVDDAPSKYGRSIHGVPVAGKISDLPRIVQKHNADELIIAIPSATGPVMRTIVKECEKTGVPFKTLPGLGEIIDGKVSVKDLRDVNYSDLLGRDPVELDEDMISSYLHHKIVLVTGPGGSIGSELCRQIVRHNPSKLILFDSSEPNLYEIQMELEHKVRYLKYVPVLGTVQKAGLTRRVFEHSRPDVVFHAAAYKHVPMLELNPWQAVWNNVLGTQTMMSLSVEYDVERFILVSTDKAVRPTNVMGASKRCCERLMYCHMDSSVRFMAVRFGNVVGSAGSVVPLFRKQIAMGGPVTVTHPEMTRYFMTIPEAGQLILQAGALGKGGELFILDMGRPIRIVDMARDLIKLSGKEPEKDIRIEFGKIRPGEKLNEELITDGEGIVPTDHEKIMVLKPDGCFDDFGNQEEYRRWLEEEVQKLYKAAAECDTDAIKQCLKAIVPEFVPQDSTCVLRS